MIDDQVNGTERIDLPGISTESLDRVAHGREVDDGGNAGEVLKEVANIST